MDQWTRLDPIYDSEAAARTIAAAAAARADAQDHDGGFPQDDVADLARLGLLAAPVPVEQGGAGLGTEPGAGALAEVLRLVGYGSLALGRLYEGHVNAIQLIARYGTPDQRSRLFADARAGHLFGVWNTEPAEGGLRVEARDTDGQLLGVKTFASGAGYVTRALVTARHPDRAGVAMMVVPLEAGTRADLSAWRAQGMRASATGTVDFTGLAVNAGDILGQPDDYFQQPAFSGGAWRFAAVQLGGIEAVFDAWRGHLNRTGRGGDPHQLARLGEGAIAVEGARLWIERGAQVASDAGMPPARVVAYINLVRLAVERAGLDVLQLAQRSVGLQGFMRGHRLERLARDLATYLRQPGPDHALTAAASEILQADAMAGDLWTETAA
ncbi:MULTISPECIES: acyl-CoA dehydrogenase family protein [Methylobacterium]|jgi:alkylation response protein AidB-like acyl-CoA dehydrogenase|uniref:Acyl-CoA dehydrogenase n=3 Tax=Methylobacterium TaxID=407 RepID=A0AAE8HWQ0_9HYPH|nr:MULTISPECIES: acyl-CoA dehydrogenase family protein [Methylobacterium]AIQ91574.1 Acyl-CoA dehydrogenase type 2 domain-containing protein [Methylobacterium oryzae CBMB20]APT32098.1 sulfur Metabolism [Methylobacterium phyllosphaerae]MBA9062330.1 alkylation response protein AidB-like acyl-CoA dehydrogenase [Methylobacterium fujisawaense]MDE4912113.1 acyl-CoA/acyl-ACP dehydrogenase [Methylobacterium sp. 092160098-2]MDH3031373.1 acyl-CoA/acyl-ACP dehydrogenase [Methylobacterium fujisawaense]